MTTGKPEHFANDEMNNHCVFHDEDFEGDRCLKCHPIGLIEKRKVKEPAKGPSSVTHDQVKKAVQKISKLRAGKHQLQEMCDELRELIEKRIQKPESITYAEIVGVLDMLRMEYHREWWLDNAILNDVVIP